MVEEAKYIVFADTQNDAVQAAFANGARYANMTWVESAEVLAQRLGKVIEVKYE